MDKSDVTNAEFAGFVKATGYVTVAERKPRAEDYPGARPELLVEGSMVFTPPPGRVALERYARQQRNGGAVQSHGGFCRAADQPQNPA